MKRPLRLVDSGASAKAFLASAALKNTLRRVRALERNHATLPVGVNATAYNVRRHILYELLIRLFIVPATTKRDLALKTEQDAVAVAMGDFTF